MRRHGNQLLCDHHIARRILRDLFMARSLSSVSRVCILAMPIAKTDCSARDDVLSSTALRVHGVFRVQRHNPRVGVPIEAMTS